MPDQNLLLHNRQRKVPLRLASLRPGFEAVMTAAGVADREVSVVFVSDPAIHRANRDWRGVDRPPGPWPRESHRPGWQLP